MQKIDITAKDGANIPTIFYEAENESKKGVAIICHGFGEHAASYLEYAENLWRAGYASVILNQRGHGKPPANSKKFHGLIPKYQCFVDDVISVTNKVKEMIPNSPLFLIGHSMGGNIAVNTLLRMPASEASRFSCAVMESAWLGFHKPAKLHTTCMVGFLNLVAPDYTVSAKINYSDISADEKRSAGYEKDPLYHGTISVRMLYGIAAAGRYAVKNANRLSVPTLLAYADNEVIVSNKAMLEFADRAGDIVTVKEYDSNHAIHNDKSNELYFRDVIEFIDLHCGK